MKRFDLLLKKFLDNTATPQEVDEYLKLALDEEHLKALEQVIDESEDIEGLNKSQKFKVLQSILAPSKSKLSMPRILWMAAAVVLPLVVSIWLYRAHVDSATETSQIAQEKIINIQGPDYVRLPDESRVQLKAGSKLTYNGSFGGTTRDVTLSGEAFFDVAHDPSKPFKVHTGKIITRVLGTAFNVNATSGNEVTVTVTRGKVAVGDECCVCETIIPNEQIAVNTSSLEFVKRNVDARVVTQWTNDFFILDGVSMEQVAVQIGKRYNVKVTIDNEALKKCLVSAWFMNKEGLDQVVESVSAVWQAEYTIKNSEVTIKGGVGCD